MGPTLVSRISIGAVYFPSSYSSGGSTLEISPPNAEEISAGVIPKCALLQPATVGDFEGVLAAETTRGSASRIKLEPKTVSRIILDCLLAELRLKLRRYGRRLYPA